MAIPFTVDISAFYGEPDFREQDSGTIVDRRKTLNLHKELEAPVNNTSKRAKQSPPQRKKRGATKRTSAKSAGAIAFKDTGGAIAFNGATKDVSSGGGCKPGGALAFNEVQLMNELTGLKKGGALGTIAATIIPALIQMAPQIISSLKSLISGKEGGALKFGGASAVFLNVINPGDYDDVLRTMKAIQVVLARSSRMLGTRSKVGTTTMSTS